MLKSWSNPSVQKATLAVAVFAVSLATYLSALAPTITWEHHGADSGDLATAVAVLGVPHPTGYPTYILLAKAMTFLFPFGETAFRLNLMSALLGSTTILIVYLAVFDLCSYCEGRAWHADTNRAPNPPASPVPPSRNKDPRVLHTGMPRTFHLAIPIAATLTALALAFSPVLWSQSIITEVYALYAFFAALLIFLLLRYLLSLNSRLLPWMAFLFALGLGNHLALGLMLPPMVALLARNRKGMTARIVIASMLAFAGGLLVYLYLPWSASRNPPVSWGDPKDWRGFLWTATGSYYHRLFFSLPISYLPQRLASWVLLLLEQYNVLGFLLGCMGAVVLWWQRRPLFYYAVGTSALVTIFALTYNTTDSYLLLFPFFILFSLLIGLGTCRLLLRLQEPLARRPQPIIRGGISFALVSTVLLLLVPLWSLALNFRALNLHGDRLALEYAKETVDAAGEGAIILADTDPHIFALLYYRYVAEPHSTVRVIVMPLLSYEWYRRQVAWQFPGLHLPQTWRSPSLYLQELVARNLSEGAIYLTDEEPGLLASFQAQRKGNLLKLSQ